MNATEHSLDPLVKHTEGAFEKLATSSNRAKGITYALRIPVMILGASAAIVLGYQVPTDCQSSYQLVSRNIALILSATITLLTGLASFWDVESYWLRKRTKLAKVEALREECVLLKLAKKDSSQEINDIISRYLAIIDGFARLG
jgi:hypothetical protein